jgi:DNA-binding NarL/FixJ family response regulator
MITIYCDAVPKRYYSRTQVGRFAAKRRQAGRQSQKRKELNPDIVILDISMPDLNGVDAAKRIRKALPDTEILFLSVHSPDELLPEILEAGVRGYIVKADSGRDLIAAVEALANHKPFFTAQTTEMMLAKFNKKRLSSEKPAEPTSRDRLTSREREVVQLSAEGKSTKEIASSLSVSVKTVETHRANIMRKLKMHSVTELVRYAVRNKIIEP